MSAIEFYAAEFDRCAPFIARSLDHGFGAYDLDDIRNACLAGHMQLWPAERSAAVTEIVHYPSRTGLIVAFAGGELEELKALMPNIKAFALNNGCDFWATNGRPGWARALGIGRVVSTLCAEDL